MTRLALTPGEPAGIGPDLAIMLAQRHRAFEIVAFADADLLSERAKTLGLSLTLREYDPNTPAESDPPTTLCLRHVPLTHAAHAGKLDPRNAAYVLKTLDLACDACTDGTVGGMVTAPVHKGVINDAGIVFTGHTEYLAGRTGGDPVMMLVADSLRVALATTHLPLRAVADAITPTTLQRVVRILAHDLTQRFGIAEPRVLVCGLNPHAGEGGHLGREEIEIIEPTLEALRAEGLNLVGPLPADTLFTAPHLDKADAVLAMYHDQGLPVLKHAGFGHAVNVTLGLPIVRTSVDHGTAIDKAGTGAIHAGSLVAAVSLAASMVSGQPV